jgi:hypothetical protein
LDNLAKIMNVGHRIHIENLKISAVNGQKNPKFNKRRASTIAVGLEKNTKLINIGPTFIRDYRVDSPVLKQNEAPLETFSLVLFTSSLT